MREDLVRSQYIAWRIFVRDINARYRQTLLGFFWAFVPPIVVALGFTWAGQAKVISVGETQLPYPAYVMLSMVLWQVFSEAVLGPVQAVTEAKHMLAKVNFPREAIVVAKIWEVLFSFLVKMLLVVGLFAWFRLPVSLSAVFAPIGVLTLVLVGVAFGVLVAPLAALYHDFSKGLTVILGGWLFLTPVVYPLPETNGLVSKLIYANPVTAPLVTTRDWITGYFPVMLTEYWIVAGCALIMLSVTWVIFRLAMPYVLERLTS